MRPRFAVREKIAAWLNRKDREGVTARFRTIFVGLWLAYDVADLFFGTTEYARFWFPHPRAYGLLIIQCGLVLCALAVLRGRRIYPFAILVSILRLLEARVYLNLNDFYFNAVTMLLLAHSDGGPFEEGAAPLWVREVLLLELAWIYLATAILKLNDNWLSGGHLFVRTGYLSRGLQWPFPDFFRAAVHSLRFDAVLARFGVIAEFLLAWVLWMRRPYALAVCLVLGIHVFGMLVTNVWFFSLSMVAAVVMLLPPTGNFSELKRIHEQ